MRVQKSLLALGTMALTALTTPTLNAAVSEKQKVESAAKLGSIAGVPAKFTKQFPLALKNSQTPLNRYLLKVEFGKISAAQFQMLKARFGNFSHVTYSDTKSYSLTDFLPPVMQALVNQQYVLAALDLESLGIDINHPPQEFYKAMEGAVFSGVNCISAAYEVSRLLGSGGVGLIDFYGASRS